MRLSSLLLYVQVASNSYKIRQFVRQMIFFLLAARKMPELLTTESVKNIPHGAMSQEALLPATGV